MRFLVCSFLLLLFCCKSEYKGLQSAAVPQCLDPGKEFQTGWYNTHIAVYGHKMSGLLLIKNTGNGAYRTVFTSETGVSLFDLSFEQNGAFKVKRIIKQLNRKAVIKMLREDFSLLLRIPYELAERVTYRKGDEVFIAARQKNETAYFITDRDCSSLRRLELGSKRKTKVSIFVSGPYDQPTSMEIVHHHFDMLIKLKKIERE